MSVRWAMKNNRIMNRRKCNWVSTVATMVARDGVVTSHKDYTGTVIATMLIVVKVANYSDTYVAIKYIYFTSLLNPTLVGFSTEALLLLLLLLLMTRSSYPRYRWRVLQIIQQVSYGDQPFTTTVRFM
jgi:hypothetical protein